MGLDDILYGKGISKLGFPPTSRPFKTLEIFSTTLHDQPLTIESDPAFEIDLPNWLRSYPPELRGLQPAGGLRLLYHEWDGYEDFLSRPVSPISKGDLDEIIAELHLPTSYPYDFQNPQPTPTRIEKIETPSGTEIAIVFQSPKLIEAFMTLVLSYDPKSNITCGYLGYTNTITKPGTAQRPSMLQPILADLRSAAQHASHPMLLPILSFGLWCEILRNEFSRVDRKLKRVADDTNLMREYFFGYGENVKKPSKPEDVEAQHSEMHQILADQHFYLTGQTGTFIEALSDSATAIFTRVQAIIPNQHVTTFDAGTGLKTYLQHVQEGAKVEMKHKERLLSRLDMLLQILYNLIQQRDSQINLTIARETIKDSKAMKSISLLTFVFLPGTAMATIFAIGPFFSTDPTTSKLSVSSDFWIYWVVVIPLTLLLVVIWIFWVQLDLSEGVYAAKADRDVRVRRIEDRPFKESRASYDVSPRRPSSRHSKRYV